MSAVVFASMTKQDMKQLAEAIADVIGQKLTRVLAGQQTIRQRGLPPGIRAKVPLSLSFGLLCLLLLGVPLIVNFSSVGSIVN